MRVENLKEILALHLEWWKSDFEKGRQADFKNANLEKADLYSAYLEQALFWGTNLRGAHLVEANLEDAYLKETNLEDADLENAFMEGATLEGANLEGAYLKGAHLRGAYLGGAKGILTAMADGCPMYAVRWMDGIRIKAGDHWFTETEAREHWGGMHGDKEAHGKLMLVGVDALVLLAKAHWGKDKA